jgi:hypothetical protein
MQVIAPPEKDRVHQIARTEQTVQREHMRNVDDEAFLRFKGLFREAFGAIMCREFRSIRSFELVKDNTITRVLWSARDRRIFRGFNRLIWADALKISGQVVPGPEFWNRPIRVQPAPP